MKIHYCLVSVPGLFTLIMVMGDGEPQHLRVPVLGPVRFVAGMGPDEKPHRREPVVGPEWKPVEESTVLGTGVKAHATYHFNRNLDGRCQGHGSRSR
jgi:hypothetical protein